MKLNYRRKASLIVSPDEAYVTGTKGHTKSEIIAFAATGWNITRYWDISVTHYEDGSLVRFYKD